MKWAEEADARWLAGLREAAAILAMGSQAVGELGLICRAREAIRKNGVLVMRPEEISGRVANGTFGGGTTLLSSG